MRGLHPRERAQAHPKALWPSGFLTSRWSMLVHFSTFDTISVPKSPHNNPFLWSTQNSEGTSVNKKHTKVLPSQVNRSGTAAIQRVEQRVTSSAVSDFKPSVCLGPRSAQGRGSVMITWCCQNSLQLDAQRWNELETQHCSFCGLWEERECPCGPEGNKATGPGIREPHKTAPGPNFLKPLAEYLTFISFLHYRTGSDSLM